MFQPRFSQLVADGEKCQTIRRDTICRPGDQLSLRAWSGKPYRSNQVILTTGVCRSVQRVSVTEWSLLIEHLRGGKTELRTHRNPRFLDSFARADGFSSWHELREWFATSYGLPFEGKLIRWREARTPNAVDAEATSH